MTHRTRTWPVLALIALALAGCGAGINHRGIALKDLPLPAGAQVLTAIRTCDRGANPYCAEQLVVAGGERYDTSAHLLDAEVQHLRKLGWSSHNGQTGKEEAAQSPGNGLRVTYATAYNDLLAIDKSSIQRRPQIAHALSNAIFDRTPAISLMLQLGSS